MNDWLQQAEALDAADPLREYRDQFWVPRHSDGKAQLYFCGNSLGLQPKRLQADMARELEAWKTLGVEGHFAGDAPWMPYHELLREPLARLVGAQPAEVVAMNSLTVNLHLMMVSFFRPSGSRNRILIERQPFPSDRYAVESQLRFHGLDPGECLVELGGGEDDRVIEESRIEAYLREHGDQIALVLWPGVHYASGQLFDLRRIAAAAREAGAKVGFDLAHAAGNVPLALHDSGADFASWCSYKYLNAGAGAVAGCFVHERHHGNNDLPRFHGWWGADPAHRFRMGPEFHPAPGADAWQLSNPPILAMAPLRSSLQLFDEAGMSALREKSELLTGFMADLVSARFESLLEIITPADPERRGCQLSLRVRAGREAGRRLFKYLHAHGVITDWREPDVIRVAPVPLYNRFEDCARFGELLTAYPGSP
ncbi:MAG: kynureninase [Xanthomonadales bacterium]|nr:kynureninase [Xanthomonadales bacterium]